MDDGPQKLHYSQQDPGKRPGSHSATLNADEFVRFCDILPNRNVDIMAEVKDKNLSAVKCINAVSPPDIQKLERERARYKYLVLEHSPKGYHGIRELLKDKSAYPVLEFYRLIDDALSSPVTHGNAMNAAQHVWGHLKNACPGSEAEIREEDGGFCALRQAPDVEAGGEGTGKISFEFSLFRRCLFLIGEIPYSQIGMFV